MSIKSNVINEILSGKDFRLGSPWRYSDKSLGILIPVLRTKSPKRNYVMLEEVQDKVEISDTGSIDKAKISSKTSKPVFIRLGTVFKGATQERVVQHSTIILPEAEDIKVPVRCVHATKGINAAASFDGLSHSHSIVKSALTSNAGQSAVWDSVNKSVSRLMATSCNPVGSLTCRPDDLTAMVEQISKGKNKISEIVKKVPCLETQVGVVIMDNNGVVALECFNSSKSWRAFHEAIVNENIDLLASEMNGEALFTFNEKAIPDKLTEFVKKLEGIKENDIWIKGNSKVTGFKNEKVVGEYAVINGKWCYVFATKKENNEPKEYRIGTPNQMTLESRDDYINSTTSGAPWGDGSVSVSTAQTSGQTHCLGLYRNDRVSLINKDKVKKKQDIYT